jgi:DMSO/TMAO reductase YedYZ molybdopterin-dependent catalytic subunit
MRRTVLGAVAGILATGLGVAVAEVLAAVTRPRAGPLVAVGGTIIDHTPTPVKEFAVRMLGTADKPVLLGTIGLVLILFSAAMGAVATRRAVVAGIGAAVFGIAGAAAALSRPAATWFEAVPSLVGAGLAAVVLLALCRPLAGSSLAGSSLAGSSLAGSSPVGGGPSMAGERPMADLPWRMTSTRRRTFLRAAAAVVAVAAVAEGGAQAARRSRGGAIARSRAAIRLPAPADPAPPLPAGMVPGFLTPNTDFYRVDTALTVPRVDVGTWSLRIHGMVDRVTELSFDDLLRRPLTERHVTMTCVSNEVGGPYAGTARWLGVPLGPLLRELGVGAGADQIVARAADGMTIGTPVTDADRSLLCVAMNGEPLPLEHGFPVRMLTAGRYGYAGSAKWLTELELTTFEAYDAYWVRRGWAPTGPIQTASRIDRPRPFARLDAGRVVVSGVAWAQGRGIRAVEVRVDGNPCAAAELLPTASDDTWVQWRWTWPATPGPHTLTVRATDRAGGTQPERRVTPLPAGSTGWHTVAATVN